MKNSLTAVLAIGLIVVAGFSFRQYNEIIANRAEIAALKFDVAELRRPRPMPAEKSVTVPPPVTPPVVINSFKDLAAGIPVEGGTLTFRNSSLDPAQARKEVRVKNGESIDKRYDALYKELGWSSNQISKFREMNLDNIDARNDLLREMRKAHPGSADHESAQAATKVIVDQANAVLLDRVSQEFGSSVLEKLRDYQESGR